MTGYQFARTMPLVEIEALVLDLARLSLRGDTASVRRLVRKVVRDDAVHEQLRNDTRKELARLIAQDAAGASAISARRAEPSVSASEADGFFTREDCSDAEEPALPSSVRESLEAAIRERDHRAELEQIGLSPTSSVILTGPPGVGKTMVARWLAKRIEVPLLRVNSSAILSSFLGATGKNLRAAFQAARREPCVLFLDEFEAIGKRRDDPADVGELKRAVSVLLTELDDRGTDGLVVAATNHPELLDRALWRRFEMSIALPMPDVQLRAEVIEKQLRRYGRELNTTSFRTVASATQGASGAQLANLVQQAVRAQIMGASVDLGQLMVQHSLEWLRSQGASSGEARAIYCDIAHNVLKQSQREIAETLGVSHVTVGKILRSHNAAKPRNSDSGFREKGGDCD